MKNYFKKLSLALIVASSINVISAAQKSVIRPVQESDREHFKSFFDNPQHKEYVAHSKESGGMDLTMKTLFSKNPFYHTEVIEINEEFAGFINYTLYVEEHIKNLQKELEMVPKELRIQTIETVKKQRALHMLGVCEAFRRQGVAQKLFGKMVCDLKEGEAEYIMVGVKTANKPARALYKKLGFSNNFPAMPGIPTEELTEEQQEQLDKTLESIPQQTLFLKI